MLFNSNDFLIFFGCFLVAYHLMRNHLSWRNLLILVASYVFYGWWDIRFLALLAFSSFFDFLVGRWMENSTTERRRRWLLIMSLSVNLTILGVFKYYDFFIRSLATMMQRVGWNTQLHTLGIILPVGISFYTFQSLSYVMDVYRKHLAPSRKLVEFLAFVAFFPQLVAGPISRAVQLLPQFGQTRWITLPMIQEGVWLCIWGMFKKVVLADNLAPLVDLTFADAAQPSGLLVLLAAIAFGLQIYCDFSGYSDIARGVARLMGFDIMQNFRIPYAATSVREFWGRWHISLSTWFRDYFYVCIGGNRGSQARTLSNLALTMTVAGLWHGAAATFLLWGVWHGLVLVIHRVWLRSKPPSFELWTPVAWSLTMAAVLFGWLLFRARSLAQVGQLLAGFMDWSPPFWLGYYGLAVAIYGVPLVLMEWWQERTNNTMIALTLSRWPRVFLQTVLLMLVGAFWEKQSSPFIYFQF